MLKIVLFFYLLTLYRAKKKMHVPVTVRFPDHVFNENIYNEGVYLTLPPHIFLRPSEVWIMLHLGSVGCEFRMK